MNYTPYPPPRYTINGEPLRAVEELNKYLNRELWRIKDMLDKHNDYVQLRVAPEKPQYGMTRWADGTGWNPGQGAGLVLYDTDDTWKYFLASSTITGSDISTHISDTSNPHSVTYTQVGAAPASHTHDDRYYTETEMDALLDAKQDAFPDFFWMGISG
jgi:hypothetical protein